MTTEKPRRAIVIDTREKSPWSFPSDVAIERRKLVAGDYSVSGMESMFAIERKSIDDLVQTIMVERKRFAAELSILSTMRYAAIVVEATLVDVAMGKYTSQWKPTVVLSSIAAIQVNWRIPILFACNRGGGALLASYLLRKCESNFSDALEVTDSQRDAKPRN